MSQLTFKFTRGGIKLNPQKLDFFQHEYRNLLFKTPLSEQTPREQALIRENLLKPLVDEVLALTASSMSDPVGYKPIQPRGTSLIWPAPLSPVPVMLSEDSQQPYAFEVLSHETARYGSAAEIARQLPYFFWRPPPAVYRAALASDPIRHDLLHLVNDTVNGSLDAWELVLDHLLERVPSDQAPDLHAVLRLIAIGSPHAVGKTSRVLFNVLGQEEWRSRTAVVRKLLDELDQGGDDLRQTWLNQSASLTPAA